MAVKRKGFPKHATVSALKEYIPQSQRQMKQYIPQTEMDWNDPRREKLDHYVTEGDATMPSGPEVVGTSVDTQSVNTQPINTEQLPSASSNEPRATISTPTEVDTSDIDARFARRQARREGRQEARQSRRDARQKRKMDRINNRTERQEARRARRAARKANRTGLGSKIRELFSGGGQFKQPKNKQFVRMGGQRKARSRGRYFGTGLFG